MIQRQYNNTIRCNMGNLVGRMPLSLLSLLLLFMSCACTSGNKASVSVHIGAANGEDVVLTCLDVNRNSVVDTLTCDESGNVKFKVKVPAGNPDFYYLYLRGDKIASLVLKGGDKVRLDISDSGSCAIEGSEESELLMEAEARYAEVSDRFEVLSDRLIANYEDVDKADGFRRDMGQLYVSYYRECVNFVMEHPGAMASVSVLFQRIGDNLQVFATDTDAAHFKRVRDSIAAVYPESKYLVPMDNEISSRESALELRMRLETSKEIGFPDLILPDTQGKEVQLSSVDARLILLHFWTASDASQNIYNTQVLKPLYDKYRAEGLEIYAVSYDIDKAHWAGIVREQDCGWINVNDCTSSSSLIYNVTDLPMTFVICGNTVTDSGVFNRVRLERIIRSGL